MKNSLTEAISFTRRKIAWISLVLLISSFPLLYGQPVKINASETPLNEVVFDLMDEYQVQVSFNDRQLSRKKITLSATYPDVGSALQEIMGMSGFEVIEENDVFVIIKRKPVSYVVSGSISDKFSHESLPFAHVIVNGAGMVTDLGGKFSLVSDTGQFSVSILYLGYYRLDTLLGQGDHMLFLTPSVHGLEEITIEGKEPVRTIETGQTPGSITLNQKTARKIPGNGDNAIYNFLRLQPGILAAGESSNDLIIWGSYEGQSKIIFDGFTLYGLKNFNDNIGAVNPYMSKHMMVLKGGYGAEYGGRVGGIVDITGISGNTRSPSINLNINNMTMNGMASVPLPSQQALTIAFRRTYYNLYNPDDIQIPWGRRETSQDAEITIAPAYTFGDFNLKFAGEQDRLGEYYVSIYRGTDDFSYEVNQRRDKVNVDQDAGEKNSQWGGAFFWGKKIGDRMRTDVTIKYSTLNSGLSLTQDVSRIINDEIVFTRIRASGNDVTEYGVSNRYYYSAGLRNRHVLEAGIGYDLHDINMLTTENGEEQLNRTTLGGIAYGYLTDHIHISEKLELRPGVRADLPILVKQVFLQPRISIIFKPLKKINTYIAWGKYNQFITKTSLLDDYGNYQYFWALADNEEVPVLHSWHHVAGISYHNKYITLSGEGYYKTTKGLTRYVERLREDVTTVFTGSGKSIGADFLVKGRYKGHEAWIAYTLSKTTEQFPYFPDEVYRYAPQDQRHEIKASLLLDLKPFSFTASQVYGSGLISLNRLFIEEPPRIPYSRLDVALTYNLNVKDYSFELGASVLNVLNHENIKYSNFFRVPADQLTSSINIHAEAVPFTPTIYLNLAF